MSIIIIIISTILWKSWFFFLSCFSVYFVFIHFIAQKKLLSNACDIDRPQGWTVWWWWWWLCKCKSDDLPKLTGGYNYTWWCAVRTVSVPLPYLQLPWLRWSWQPWTLHSLEPEFRWWWCLQERQLRSSPTEGDISDIYLHKAAEMLQPSIPAQDVNFSSISSLQLPMKTNLKRVAINI